MPGATALGITQERLRLGPGLCGWLEGRSRFARLGLAGSDGAHQRPAPLAVHPGTAICQFVFQILQGSESYSGRFAGQTEHSF